MCFLFRSINKRYSYQMKCSKPEDLLELFIIQKQMTKMSKGGGVNSIYLYIISIIHSHKYHDICGEIT